MRKKELFKILLGVASIYIITGLVACGNNNQNNPVPVAGPGAVPGTGVVCPAGSSLNTINGLCIAPNGQVVSSTSSNTIDFMADSYDGTVTITDSSAYKSFLKNAMGVCDNMSWSTGAYDCSSWDNGRLSIVILANTSNSSLYAYFWPYQENKINIFNVNFGLANTNSFWPLVLTMPTSPYNNSQGFMAQSKGNTYTKGYQSVISIVVNQGKIQDGYFDFMLSYSSDGQPVNARVFANGRFTKCSTKQCVNR